MLHAAVFTPAYDPRKMGIFFVEVLLCSMRVALLKSNAAWDYVFDKIEAALEGSGHAVANARLKQWKRFADHDVFVGIGVGKSNTRGVLTRDLMRHCQRHGKRYLCIEQAVFRNYNRDLHFSLGWWGLSGYSDFRNTGSPADRFSRLGIELRPWRTGKPSDSVLLALQLPWDSAVSHLDYTGEVRGIIDAVLKGTRRLLRIKTHPLYRARRDGRSPAVKRDIVKPFEAMLNAYRGRAGVEFVETGDLAALLEDTWCLVAVNSNAATDAVISGVPAVVTDRGAFAWGVSGHDASEVDTPPTPDRTQWAHDAAYSQWKIDEVGAAMRRLGLR